jgi:predicted trehalose synthase
VGALDRAGFTGMLPWVGDVLVPVADGAYGPVAAATIHPADGHQLHDQLVGLVAGHLRGGDEVEPTLQLAHRTGRALAGLHLALAALRGPDPSGWIADAERVAGWRRDASDAVAEAVVLAEGEPGDRLRARRLEVRAAFDTLTTSVGSPLLPALPFPGLEALVVVGGGLLVDPLALGPATELRRSPVRDVAACVRAVDHVARSVHRRLVGGGFPAPLERVTSWYEAVREGVLDAYRARLAEEGESELFDERLLWAFEVEAECRSLSRASRFLPTARGISDAALADLLTTA